MYNVHTRVENIFHVTSLWNVTDTIIVIIRILLVLTVAMDVNLGLEIVLKIMLPEYPIRTKLVRLSIAFSHIELCFY